MRPVLLPRHEVDKKKAEEKRQAIEEGMRIATKVDSLREKLSSEEAASKTYLSGILKGLQEDIAAKRIENETLDASIVAKREEWHQLMQPIDKNWMWFVKGEKTRIENQITQNEVRERDLQIAIHNNLEQERMLQEKNKNLDSDRSKYAQLIHSAKEAVKHAKNSILEARKNARNLFLEAEERIKRSKMIEEKALTLEKNNELKEKELKKFAEELEEREFKVLAKELQFYSPVQKR